MREALREVAGRGRGVGAAAGEVLVLLDTPKTVLVPTEIFRAGDAASYLTINNMSPGQGEHVVVTGVNAEITAVMAFDGEALATVREVFGAETGSLAGGSLTNGAGGGGLTFGSPFERVVGMGSRIYLTGSNLYAAVVREGQLVWFDMLPYSCAADLRYYAAQLTAQFPHLEQVRFLIMGLGAQTAARELRKIFRNICY